jgi:hypothetical protein
MISSSATTASPPIPASSDRNSKLRLAQREARNARRHGDDDTAVLWYGVAIRELRGSTSGSTAGQAEHQQQQELLGALLVKRGSARRRLQAQLLRRRETRGRAHGLGEDALADYVEAVWRHPGQVKAHRKRIEIALSNGCALPVLLSLCADVHDAMGLATDPTAVQWQLSQLEPEPEEGAETMHRDDAAAAAATSEHGESSDGALRAATVSAVLPALERTIVAELTAKHVTYDDGSLASVAEAVAAEAQLVAQPHAHEGVVLRGSKLERQRQEAAAFWVLLRHAGPADLAGCGNTLCQRLVAHLAADLEQPLGHANVGSQEEQWRLLLLARCRTALQLMAGLRGLGLQPWCVNSQQFRRPVQERHRHEPAHAQRLAHRAAEVENRAAAASMRALLMRAEAGAGAGGGLSPSSLTSSSAGTAFGDAAGDGSALQSAESAAAVLAAQVAAEGHHMHAEAQRTRLLRQRNQTDREEGRTENYGPGPFRLPTEITLVLNDEWEPLCDSLQQWIRSLSGSTMDGGVN